jgi:flagellar motility protein MotE (MotC chaperone)
METARKEHDEANWVGLVKTYESMKPREAAVIFNEMEMPVLLAVMDRMKDTKVAAILGVMQPDRARMVTAGLAAMRTKSVTVPDHAG